MNKHFFQVSHEYVAIIQISYIPLTQQQLNLCSSYQHYILP